LLPEDDPLAKRAAVNAFLFEPATAHSAVEDGAPSERLLGGRPLKAE
jgi:hypothetical protein